MTDTDERRAAQEQRLDEVFVKYVADKVEYGQMRKDVAAELGINVKFLDEEMSRRAGRAPRRNGETKGLFDDPEPDEVVDSVYYDDLANEICDTLTRHLVLPQGAAEVMTVWIFHTWIHDRFHISPILFFRSPQRGCGKTTALDILGALCRRGLLTTNLTAPVLFRVVDQFHPTVLVDEADTFLHEDKSVQNIINAGWSRGVMVPRCEGENREIVLFDSWAPKAIASIKNQSEAIMDRSIVISMHRPLPNEKHERLPRALLPDGLGHRFRERLAGFGADEDITDTLIHLKVAAEEGLPKEMSDRAQDNWRQLLVTAGQISVDWHGQITEAMKVLGQPATSDSEDSVRLLEDVRFIFNDQKVHDSIYSFHLCEELNKLDDSPWLDFRHGKGINQHRLARELRNFDIKPMQIRTKTANKQGYKLEDFKDAFERYLSPASGEK